MLTLTALTCTEKIREKLSKRALALQDYYSSQTEMLSVSRKEGHRKVGIIIHFVVAGQIANFRLLESRSTGPIDVMPVHVEDVFRQDA